MRHPFVACFLVLAAIDVLIVVAAACARAVVCRGRPLAFHTLAIWSIVVLSLIRRRNADVSFLPR